MTTEPAAEPILLREEMSWGVRLVLNRPAKLNALSHELRDVLTEAIAEAADDERVRVIVIAGAGRAFCSGYDLAEGQPSDGWGWRRVLIKDVAATLAIWRCPKPVIAQVHGYCLAMGSVLALMCDITMAAEDARFGPAQAPLGAGAVAPLWIWLIGAKRSKEIFLPTGVMIDGKEADRIGLVNYAVPREQVMPRAMEIARRLAQGAPMAIRWTKYSINKILRDHVNLALDSSMFLEAITMSSEDLEEAARAFFDKRRPLFKGR